MRDALHLLLSVVRNRLRTLARLQLENLALRHQLAILQRRQIRRPRLTALDRALMVWLYRLWPHSLDTLVIIKPETVIRWHRRGFRRYWRWNPVSGRPGGQLFLARFATSFAG